MLERRVAVVRAVEVVEPVADAPSVHPRVRDVRPVKRSARQRLRAFVDRHGVVQGRGPKAVAQRRIGGVAGRSWIDQDRHASNRQGERQRVGMRMAGVQVPVGTAVDDRLEAGRARYVVSRRRQACRNRGGGGSRWCRRRVRAEQPQRFLRRRFDLEIGAVHQRRGNRQAVAEVVRVTAGKRRQYTAVVVADMRDPSALIREESRGGSQADDRFLERGCRFVAGVARDD